MVSNGIIVKAIFIIVIVNSCIISEDLKAIRRYFVVSNLNC